MIASKIYSLILQKIVVNHSIIMITLSMYDKDTGRIINL